MKRRSKMCHRSAMPFLFVPLSLLLTLSDLPQTLTPSSTANQRVDVVARSSAENILPGQRVELWADVTPKPNIHVYAPGAKGFDAISLIVSPKMGLTFGKPTYPAGTWLPSPGAGGRVPVYTRTFRIMQPLTPGRGSRAGEVVTIAGAVNYQACDDRLCYPTASVPVNWTIRIR
jgi:hypothetical protein